MDQSLRTTFSVLHIDASDEKHFGVEVVSFEVDDALSSAFRIAVYFLSESPNLAFDDIVGRGAALSLFTMGAGQRVWAGVCTELELEDAEEHGGGHHGGSYKGRSRYRMVIRPDLWRLTLRTNCRIFQHVTAAEIAKTILAEWGIGVVEELPDPHPQYEYKVQYNETDFDFVSRILEDAGITYVIQPAPQVPITSAKKGAELTKVIFRDSPANAKPLYDADERQLPYLGDGLGTVHEHSPHIWMLSGYQQPKSLHHRIRDRDWRGRVDQDPEGMMTRTASGRAGTESTYESFSYEPGTFWFDGQSGGGTPVADDRGVARIAAEQVQKIPDRRFHADLSGRMIVRFKTNALDLDPGTVFQIGSTDTGYDHNHPHKAFAPGKRLLVISRSIVGRQLGDTYVADCVAVYADAPYYPERLTPKPRIYGVQSAVIVGPSGKEIHVDEFGRVRVQFPWDRYNGFNDQSSCWMRVSQAWAGGGFGLLALPRVGHEVLVSFFEGDPDQPVVTGRVFNATTNLPYQPTGSSPLGTNDTLTGLRTQSSPHTGGYNEMMFQDQPGNEKIAFQAQKDLSYVVNNVETHDVGTAVSYKVGKAESHDVGQAVSYKVGKSETHDIGEQFSIKVGTPDKHTEFTMTPTGIKITTGKASIELDLDWIKQNAEAECHIHASKNVHLSSQTIVDVDAERMTIDTKKTLELNCGEAKICEAKPAPAQAPQPPAPPTPGKSFPKPAMPAGGGPAPRAPTHLEHVNVKSETEELAPPTDRVGPLSLGGGE